MATRLPERQIEWRRPTVRPQRPRVLLTLALLAAAMPLRLPAPVVGTISLLDMVLIVAAASLLLDLPFRRLEAGPRTLLLLLAIPLVASVVAVGWSQDRGATVGVCLVSIEALVAYLLVMRELEGLPSRRIIRYIEWFTVLLILPAVFLLLGVPGFEVREAGLTESSGDYFSYFTRLSHPVLGRSNNLATVLVIFLPVLLWWGHVHRRGSATFVGITGVVAVAATQSRGVLLAAVISLVLYAMVRPLPTTRGRPVLLTVLMSAAAVVIGGTVLYLFNPPTQSFATGRFSPENVELRGQLVETAFGFIQQRPWLGWGPGAVPQGDSMLVVDVHNTYVQQLLSFGVPLGLVVGACLLALPVWFFIRSHQTPVAGAVSLAVLIEVLSFAFESSYEGVVLRVIFYLSLGLLAALVEAAEDG